jgi:hypothetical protein
MPRILAIIGLRLFLCCAAALGFWYLLGAFGLAMSAPLFGALLAKPILELIAELRHSAKAVAYADVEGRYFEHRGFRFTVVEDDRHHRWVRISDVRKAIPKLPSDGALRRQFPQGLRDDPVVKGPVIHADALLAYLGKSSEPDSVKFRNWLAREVVRPAATIRGRLGIRDPVPTGTDPPPPAP